MDEPIDKAPPLPDWWPRKIVSGGQTGVDRAALDWAIRNGVEHGGWCPKGRLASDGAIPDVYQLQETESAGYRQRTKLNVRDSDATLVINSGELDGGTLATVRLAEKMGKSCLVVQVDEMGIHGTVSAIARWLEEHRIATLNVAGPRQEKRPGIYVTTLALLSAGTAH